MLVFTIDFASALFVFVAIGSFAISAASEKDFSPRLVGGKAASYERSYFFVRVTSEEHWSKNSGIDCAGTIIAEDYVLTAAYCTPQEREYDPKNFPLYVKDYTSQLWLRSGKRVQKATVHKGFTYPYSNNIAILKLELDHDISPSKVLPLCSPEAAAKPHELFLLGLRSIIKESPMIEKHECSFGDLFKGPDQDWAMEYTLDFDKIVCAGQEGVFHAIDDSGAPLVLDDGDHMCLYGIVNTPSTGDMQPFTRVTSYLDWISSNMQKNSTEKDFRKSPQKVPRKSPQKGSKNVLRMQFTKVTSNLDWTSSNMQKKPPNKNLRKSPEMSSEMPPEKSPQKVARNALRKKSSEKSL